MTRQGLAHLLFKMKGSFWRQRRKIEEHFLEPESTPELWRTWNVSDENEPEAAAESDDVRSERMSLEDLNWLAIEAQEPGGVQLDVPHDDGAGLVAGNDRVRSRNAPADRVDFAALEWRNSLPIGTQQATSS